MGAVRYAQDGRPVRAGSYRPTQDQTVADGGAPGWLVGWVGTRSLGVEERRGMAATMDRTTEELEEVGLEVVDVAAGSPFLSRRLHARDGAMQMEAMHRLAETFVKRPETILQELADAAVRMCGADSAGISMEREDRTEAQYYQWIATAGEYTSFLHASLPQYPSACTVCLYRGGPQHFRVGKRFFDLLGVEAAEVTDGILLPWEVEEMRGTIFILAHGRTEAFDGEDLRLMQVLAKFAAMGIRHQRQQARLVEQARAASAAATAHALAHQINNPLQGLTNQLYLAEQSGGGDERSLALKMSGDFGRLTALVEELLGLAKRAELVGAGR